MVLAAQGLADEAKGLSFTLDGAPSRGRSPARSGGGSGGGGAAPREHGGGAGPGVAGRVRQPDESRARRVPWLHVERSLHRLDGSVVDPATGIRQNDRLVVVLKVTEAKAEAARLLLVDRLPAGLEIDNPKLLDADALKGLAFAKSDVQPVHTEFRDDRFVAAYTREPSQPAVFTWPTRCGRSRRGPTSIPAPASRTCTARPLRADGHGEPDGGRGEVRRYSTTIG